jgi:GTP cyclohydrolase I
VPDRSIVLGLGALSILRRAVFQASSHLALQTRWTASIASMLSVSASARGLGQLATIGFLNTTR